MSTRIAGREAAQKKGWLQAQKWLLLRRLSQFAILGLFLLGPMAGLWIIKGSMSASCPDAADRPCTRRQRRV